MSLLHIARQKNGSESYSAHLYLTHSPAMDIFAARLKSARKAKGMTQRELAARVGMDQGHISRLEHGGKGASMEHIQALARELGVAVSHLLGEDAGSHDMASRPSGLRGKLLSDYSAPAGLRDLASDSALADALKISEPEWRALASLDLPGEVRKDGYVQLLITIRAVAVPVR